MQESIHGHNVLKLIKSQNEPMSQQQLLNALTEHFGEDSRYHTCSAQELSAEELLQIFIKKGKLAKDGDHIRFVGCQCGH